MKICIKCKLDKELQEFHKNKKTKDGLCSICKKCRSTKKPNYGEKIIAPKEKNCTKCNILKAIIEFPQRKEARDGYRNICYDCKNKRHVEYRKENYDKSYRYHLEYGRKHRPENREKYREYVRNYRIRHPERRRIQDKKRRENPNFRVKQNLRGRIRDILRKQGAVKSNKTMALIGCDIPFFMNYLQSLFYNKNGQNMTLELLSTPQIELDHITPLWKFDLSNPKAQEKAFHYTNMRPMWVDDHNIKSGKDYSEYCEWQKSGLNLQDFLNQSKNKV